MLRTTITASTSATDVKCYIQPGQSFEEQLRSCRSLTLKRTDKTGIATTANLEKRTARSLSRLELQVHIKLVNLGRQIIPLMQRHQF
jgi:hypothetical protein